MFFEKKIKFDQNFVKQGLTKIVLQKNISLFEEIKDKDPTLGDDNAKKIRKKLYETSNGDLKAVNVQFKRYKTIVNKVDKLRKKQKKRRRAYFEWFDNYIATLEGLEEQRLLDKIANASDLECLKGVLKGPITDEDLFFSAELEEYVEEIKEEFYAEEPEEIEEEEEYEEDETEEDDEREDVDDEETADEDANTTSQPQEADEIRKLVES